MIIVFVFFLKKKKDLTSFAKLCLFSVFSKVKYIANYLVSSYVLIYLYKIRIIFNPIKHQY